MGTARAREPSLEDTVRKALAPWLGGGDHFLLAVSGGADSTALLCVMALLHEDCSCLHVDHGLRSRSEAQAEESFVRELCAPRDIPLTVIHVPPGSLAERARNTGDSLEALARDLRHRALAKRRGELLAQQPPGTRVWILLAHTLNDRQEGLLLRVLRGSGPEGLVPLPESDPPFLRPLVHVPRSDIESWLVSCGQTWCEDPSNRDTVFLRNRIRHRLIPLLDEEFPFWRGGLEAFGETQALVARDLSAALEQAPDWEVREDGSLGVELSAVMNLSPLLREAFIFKGVDRLMDPASGLCRPSAGCVAPASGEGGMLSPDRLAEPLPRVPRRAVVRRFAANPSGSCDLGPCRISCANGSLYLEVVNTVRARLHVTISAPGRYSVAGLDVQLCRAEGEGQDRFFVDLPLVLALHGASSSRDFRARWRDAGGREGAFVRKDGKITVHLSSERVHSKGMYCCMVLPGSPLVALDCPAT